MNNNTIKDFKDLVKNASKTVNALVNSILWQSAAEMKNISKSFYTVGKSIPWQSAVEIVKESSTWFFLSGGLIGIAGGALLRQPEVNKLSEEVKKSQSEIESLHTIVQSYHEGFVRMQAEVDTLKAKGFAEEAKKESENGRAYIMYQYAAKEYIELCLSPRDDRGVLVLPEKEYQYYLIFRKVINGETLEKEDAKKLQNYVYPKYKQEIEGLIEFNFDGLLKKLSAQN